MIPREMSELLHPLRHTLERVLRRLDMVDQVVLDLDQKADFLTAAVANLATDVAALVAGLDPADKVALQATEAKLDSVLLAVDAIDSSIKPPVPPQPPAV